MNKKRALSLLEVLVVLVLLGIFFSSMFTLFFRTLKTQAQQMELKQTILSCDLFEQHMKHVLNHTKKIWTASHPDALGTVLCFTFTPDVDIEWDRTGELQGMLYLNAQQQLCFASWSSTEKLQHSLLLEKISALSCRLFDPKTKKWQEKWPFKMDVTPPMILLQITLQGKEVPFTFFPPNPSEQIPYSGAL